MEPWILVTLAAATLQNFRTVLQKRLVGRLSVTASTYARFLYGLPLTWGGVWITMAITNPEIRKVRIDDPVPRRVLLGCLERVLGKRNSRGPATCNANAQS